MREEEGEREGGKHANGAHTSSGGGKLGRVGWGLGREKAKEAREREREMILAFGAPKPKEDAANE